MVKTANAKNKIRAFFGKSDKEKCLERGMALVQKELKAKKITNSEFFNDETIDKLVKHLKLANLEEVYIAVGSNKIKLDQVVKKDDVVVDTKEEIVIRRTGEIHEKDIKNDIIVHGMEDLKVNIASCCMPILGDDIMGYITRGYGITVHRVVCPNIKDLEQRIIDVSWNKQPSKRYSTTIIVYASNNKNLLLDIIAKTTNFGISISNFKEIVKKDEFIFEIIVLVEDKETLNRFLETVKKIKQINNVERLMR